ncbi:MAG TPA: sigma-70 family RNA polymerase sigma factor [Chitinophagaceae bacterium]|nr:sigma-70 family RNA polymerase sigma factor [Chitinophagaceae bacterium]
MGFLKNISSTSSTDAELVAMYQQHRQMEVLSQLYQRYMELVYGVCLKYLPDSETAKDAVMNIFEELVQKLHQHQVDNFKGWLYMVAKNHCLMQLRSRKNIKITELGPALVQTEENLHLNGVMEKEAHLQSMEGCLETLPAEQKQCVELFYLQSKSYNEIVEATGFDWKQVRSFIQNGRRNLKICMDKKAVEPLKEVEIGKR